MKYQCRYGDVCVQTYKALRQERPKEGSRMDHFLTLYGMKLHKRNTRNGCNKKDGFKECRLRQVLPQEDKPLEARVGALIETIQTVFG